MFDVGRVDLLPMKCSLGKVTIKVGRVDQKPPHPTAFSKTTTEQRLDTVINCIERFFQVEKYGEVNLTVIYVFNTSNQCCLLVKSL